MRQLWRQLIVPGWNRGRSGLRLVSAFGGLLVWLAPLGLSALTFTATLDRNPIRLGESATLALTFEGGKPDADPVLPAMPNLEIAYVGPSSQVSFINGQVSSSLSYNYRVVPRQAGEFTIPSISAVAGGQRLASQPLKLTVLKPGTPPPRVPGSDSDPAFLRLALPKKELYVGEPLVAELQIYLSDKVQNAGGFQVTAIPAEGFTVRSSQAQGQRRMVQVGSAVYSQIPFEMAITPVKNGSLSIGPISAKLVVELPSTRRRRDALWDPFGLMNPAEQRTLSLATDTETVRVLPLPTEGVPGNFNGAVGNYTMTVSAGPTNVAVGDPITVKVQITGRGALDSLTLPDQPAWRDFKIYPSTARIETSDALGIQGAKIFEQVIVPQNNDLQALPPVSFSYFDSDSKSYRTLTGPGIALAVRPGGAAAVPVIAAAGHGREENQPPAQDIVSIKQRLGQVAQVTPPLVQQPWFLALQSVPALAWLGSVIWRRRTEQLANNPRLRRRRQVADRVREGRNELRAFAAENNSDQFFGTLFRLLQEQLGERLDLPASAITEAVIEERLQPAGMSEATLTGLHELFQACNLARYAPVRTGEELAAYIPKIETVLRDLQDVKL